MSELINTAGRSNAKWQLLASVSVLALIANAASQAKAEDTEHPTVWIEAGAQLERLTNGQDPFAPPFVATLLQNPFTPPAVVQKPPLYAFGQEGRLSFTPDGSDWVFSASLRYGRANSSGNTHEETSPASPQRIVNIPALSFYRSKYITAAAKRFASVASKTHDSYLIADFQAGRDVGLGAFGVHSSSILNAGVRFAQFTSQSRSRIDSDPDFMVNYKYPSTLIGFTGYFKIPQQAWNIYSAKNTISRSFSGIGPTVEWDANVMLIGHPDASEVTFDWGVNGAMLFGRQKVTAHHTTMAHHGSEGHGSGALPTVYPTKIHDTARSRSVVVPNIGGFAGFSLRFPNAKVSLGYRVDAFFGAMDGGIDARKTYDRDFYGPFATISIGLGG
jgi:hypothetical protein